MQRTSVLPLDHSLKETFERNTIENNLQKGPAASAKPSRAGLAALSASFRSPALASRIASGRNSALGSALGRSSNDKELRIAKATMETIVKRNNSITVVKNHAIPFKQLHKKTYFNALEKIFISPRNLNKDLLGDKKSIYESANQAFAEVFKKPPSRLGDNN